MFQASVLSAVLGETHPGALQAALAAVPARVRKYLPPALESARRYLEPDHPRAWDELRQGAPRRR